MRVFISVFCGFQYRSAKNPDFLRQKDVSREPTTVDNAVVVMTETAMAMAVFVFFFMGNLLYISITLSIAQIYSLTNIIMVLQ